MRGESFVHLRPFVDFRDPQQRDPYKRKPKKPKVRAAVLALRKAKS